MNEKVNKTAKVLSGLNTEKLISIEKPNDEK
jgi:hypothetical protein